jgi:carbon storage regulator
MLVLTRKIGEVIHIGLDVRVMLLSIEGRQVRLGISAPADVVIVRQEIVGRPPKIKIESEPQDSPNGD